MGLKKESGREADPRIVERLLSVFRRTKADGTYYYSSEDVEHWIPIMLITLGDPASTWTADNRRIFSAFLDKVGVEDVNDGKRALTKIQAYYKKFPVNPELVRELSDIAVGVKLDANEATLRKASKVLESSKRASVTTQAGLAPPKSGLAKKKR